MRKIYRKYSMRLSTLFCIVSILVIGCSFLFESLQNINVIHDLDGNAVSVYQGGYICSEERYLRNTNYKFVLENGDTLTIPSERIASAEFDNYSTLVFTYASSRSLFALGKHHIIDIRSIDEERVFVEEDIIIQEMYVGAVGYMVIGVLCLLVVSIPFLLMLITKFRR